MLNMEEELLTCLCSPRCRRPVCETPWCNELHQQADAQSPSSASWPCMRQHAEVYGTLGGQVKADVYFKCAVFLNTRQLGNIASLYLLDSPDAQIVVLAAPAPVSVGKSIYLTKLISGQCCDATKITFVSQPVNRKTAARSEDCHATTEGRAICRVSRTDLYPVAFRPTTKCLGWLSQTYRLWSFSGTRSTSWKMKQSQL